MPAVACNPEPDPDPFFDPAQFFCEHQDWDRAAEHLRAGDVYRKPQLGLDAAGAAALRAALAPHHLVMVDAGEDWAFVDARVSGDLPTRQCHFGAHAATGPNPWCCIYRRAYMLQYRSAQTERPAYGPVYIDPDHLVAADVEARAAAGCCGVCGVPGAECQCRFCGPCARYWGAATDARRTPGALHHGVPVETCPTCRTR